MTTSTRVTYLDKELVASGAFHTLGVGTTTLRIEYDGEAVEVEFVVSETDNEPPNRMWAQVVSRDRLQIHLINFRQLMPSQTLGPADLGTLAGRALTFVCEATGVKNTPSKHIGYSVYLGGANG